MAKRRNKKIKIIPALLIILLLIALGIGIWGVASFGVESLKDPVGLFEKFETSIKDLFDNKTDIGEAPVPLEGEEIAIHMIDVGQADSILIMTPNGNMLVDAGCRASKTALKNYLDGQGIKEFEYVIFTHAHEDHIGGAAMIMKDYKVKNVIMPDATATTAVFEDMIDAIEESKANVIKATPGYTFNIGNLKNTVLGPVKSDYDVNNTSVVVKSEFGSSSIMLTGDAEEISEKDILATFDSSALDCDILKVGHHCSTTSTCKEFLSAVSPKIALISVGTGNSYGHPHKESYERLQDFGAKIYRTDVSGSVVIKTDGKTIKVMVDDYTVAG